MWVFCRRGGRRVAVAVVVGVWRLAGDLISERFSPYNLLIQKKKNLIMIAWNFFFLRGTKMNQKTRRKKKKETKNNIKNAPSNQF